MNPLYVGILLAVIASIRALIAAIESKERGSNAAYQSNLADFYNQVNGMLEEDEVLEAHCGYNPYVAVTNRRVLLGDENGIKEIPLSQIKKVRGINYSGFKTTNPKQMMTLEIIADRKYVLRNQSEGFAHVAESLDFYFI